MSFTFEACKKVVQLPVSLLLCIASGRNKTQMTEFIRLSWKTLSLDFSLYSLHESGTEVLKQNHKKSCGILMKPK